jgi:hypothetical protein
MTFQFHFYGFFTCSEWIDANSIHKFEQIAMILAVFIQQRCGCPSSSNITTPQFTCRPSHDQHVTYRASISTGTLARQELVAALEEWPRVHRSFLLQGERLSVDDTCPVIIQSLDEEECDVYGPSQPTMVSSQAVIVTLSTFLATLIPLVVAVIAAMAIIVLLSCTLWNKRK